MVGALNNNIAVKMARNVFDVINFTVLATYTKPVQNITNIKPR